MVCAVGHLGELAKCINLCWYDPELNTDEFEIMPVVSMLCAHL